MVNLASFWKPEACGQTALPDRSILKGQKLMENAKIQKIKCDILSNFQTMWSYRDVSCRPNKQDRIWRHVIGDNI